MTNHSEASENLPKQQALEVEALMLAKLIDLQGGRPEPKDSSAMESGDALLGILNWIVTGAAEAGDVMATFYGISPEQPPFIGH